MLLALVVLMGCTSNFNNEIHQCKINNLSVNAEVKSNGFYMKDPITPIAKYHVIFEIHNSENYNLTNVRIDSIFLCTNEVSNSYCYNDTPSLKVNVIEPDETRIIPYDFNIQQRGGAEKFQLIGYHHTEDTCIY